MTWRPWIVSAAMMLALMVNVVLMVQERLPEARSGPEVVRVEEILKHLKYLPSTRRNNFKEMGMTDELAEATAKYADRYARKEALFKGLLEEQAAMVGNTFCPGTEMPQPYAALEFLVKEENEKRDTIDPERLKEFEEQVWFQTTQVQAVYNHFELTEGRYADATLLGVSSLLVSLEDDALDGLSPFSTGMLGSRGWAPLKKQAPRVEVLAIQYFSLMHYLTELANTRDGICS